MHLTRTATRRGCVERAALLLPLLTLILLAVSCQDGAKILPASSPASDVVEPIGSPEVSPTDAVSPFPKEDGDEAREILDRAREVISKLTTMHVSYRVKLQQAGRQTFEMDYEVDMQYPDRAYAVFSSPGVPDFEMVIEGLDVYIRFPGQGWQADEDTSGPTLQDFRQFAQLDVFRLADDIEVLGDAEVDGVQVRHLRTTISIDQYGAAATDLLRAGGLDDELAESVEWGAMLVDIYVSPDDFHVRRARVQTTATVEGSEFRMDADAVASEFNEPVDIPEIE